MPKRMPFIVGCGRSGTTLLAAMLDSHPQVAIPGESGFILELCRRRRLRGEGIVDGFLHETRRLRRFRAWALDEDSLRQHLVQTRVTTVQEALLSSYKLYANKFGKDVPGDKTPEHVLHISELARLIPDAVFIHIVRDGRDVALSTIAAPWGPTSVEEAAFYWRRRVMAGRHAGLRLGASRYLEVKYEDLLAQPERELQRVTAFLGLRFSASMLDYRAAAARQVRMTYERPAFSSLTRQLTKGLRDWKSQLSSSDIAVFELVAGKALETFGYRLASPHAAEARLAALARLGTFLSRAPLTLSARNIKRLAAQRLRRVLLVDW